MASETSRAQESHDLEQAGERRREEEEEEEEEDPPPAPRKMSFYKEDGVGSLCHKALQIISELCLGGKVELEKCSGIFPLETTNQGISRTGRVASLARSLALARSGLPQSGPRRRPGSVATRACFGSPKSPPVDSGLSLCESGLRERRAGADGRRFLC